ncbi:MAG: transglycosylase SLT domain-containing protein [Anaerolineaceae bacterium]
MLPFRKLTVILLAMTFLITSCDIKTPPPQPTPTVAATLNAMMPTATLPPAEITPPEEVRFPEADLALSFGDYEQALSLYSQGRLFSDSFRASAAIFGEALTRYRQGQLIEAKSLWEEVRDAFPQTPAGKRASFWLGEIASQDAGQLSQAIDYYQSYLNDIPGVLDSLVYERIGILYDQLEQPENALEAFRNAFLNASSIDQVRLAMKLAGAYAKTDQPDKAIEIFQEAYAKSGDDYTKSSIDLAVGNLELNRGNRDVAFERFQDAVNNFPKSYDAYSALLALLDAEVPVDELQRGLINYYVGQPDLAIEAFDRFLESTTEKQDQALYFKALALRDQGLIKADFNSDERTTWNLQGGTPEDKEAIVIWTQMLKDYPATTYRVDTIEDIVYTQYTYMSAPQAAIDTSFAYISQTPEADYAARILWTTGRYQESTDQLEQAAETWVSIGTRFPAAVEAFNGLFFGGMLYYRTGNLQRATEALNRAVLLTEQPLELAGAYLWLGKISQKKGDTTGATQNWEAAIKADPHGYYGLRARELIEKRAPFSAAETPPRFEVDLLYERQSAADWLRGAFILPSNVNLDYSQALFDDPLLKSAIELTRLGLFDEASTRFDLLRAANENDAANLFRLIKVFTDNGFYKAAILSAKSITKLSGYGDYPFSAILPPYFAYITYGAYYQPWISAAAEKYNLPELVLYSLIHQESHFDAIAHSSAGAGGLMQVMPDTAAQIASETNYPPNFERTDLYNGYINLELGANYLARQLRLFDGDLYLALASYNGGPGSVLDWQKSSEGDPDQFLGVIRFQETRSYIRKLVENFDRYVLIYTAQ